MTTGPPPAFDPELQLIFDAVPEPVPALNDDVLRAGRAAPIIGLDDLRLGGAFDVSEVDGDGVPLVVARPTGAEGAIPCIYLLHHGGMILGDPRSGALPILANLAQPLGLTVVAAAYRRAPDVQAPVLAEDGYTGLAWLAANAEQLGVDPNRIILMGVSGGGGLAASCALMARDRGGPSIRALLLMYPMLDDRSDTPSTHQMASVGIWRKADNEYAWTQVLGDRRGGDDVGPYESPSRATDLAGLPPTYLDAGSAETFRDEIVDFASRIWVAGGAADLHVWDGGCHGFDLLNAEARIARASWQTKRDWIGRQMHR